MNQWQTHSAQGGCVNEPTYKVTSFHRDGAQRKKYFFPEGEHTLTAPIELASFDVVEGASTSATIIKVKGTFAGPFIRSRDLNHHCSNMPWYAGDGVPVRFCIKNITIDLSEWEPVQQHYSFEHGDLSRCAIGLYGKSFELKNICILNSPGSGFISVGSNKGGKKDAYLDSPEARIHDLEVINTQADGVVFAGPHDSILDNLIVSISKKKGVYIVSDQQVNGACDIGFIHAYSTDGAAIDVQAKVKARFLQADTGRGAGVVLGGSDRSIIEVVEVYKTRRLRDNEKSSYSLIIQAIETQIGIVRIRADAGADGLYFGGSGNAISNLHIYAGAGHPDFAHVDQVLPAPTAITLSGHANTIVYGRIIQAVRQPIVVKKHGKEKYFTGNFSLDISNTPITSMIYDENCFSESNITINNKVTMKAV